MSHTSMILSGLFLLAMTLFVAPNIIAMNRGRILRNVALWLAVFLGLALIYQNFGPESPHPLFQLPDSMAGMRKTTMPSGVTQGEQGKKEDDKSESTGEKGFTPPAE